MSIARVYTTKGPVRKDGLTCGKCGDPIRKGIDRRITFAVGFRGFEQTRCLKPACYPKTSELESSAVSSVYAAMEGIDLDSCSTLEELEDAVQQVADACEEVASEYQSNEMFEINEDLQERAQTIEDAGESLSDWASGLEDEPQEDDFTDGDNDEDNAVAYQEAHDTWLDAAREAAQEAIDGMELP